MDKRNTYVKMLFIDYSSAFKTIVSSNLITKLSVESFKFLGVHITNKLTWSKHTKTVVKRA